MSNVAKLLAESLADESAPERPSHTLDVSEDVNDEDGFDGEDVAIEEILDSFKSGDAKSLKSALKSFIEMCRYH